MRKKIYCLIALLILAVHATAQVSSQNYVRTTTMLNADGGKRLDETVYYDGLGRPFQTLQKASENNVVKSRLATLQEYDALGREANSWLPIAPAADYTAPASFKSSAPGNYGNDAAPYSRPVYENSPLNRPTELYGPGSAWAKHPTKAAYTSNTLESPLHCIRYTVSGSSLAGGTKYQAGELAVVRTQDEDGHLTYTFTDKQGRTLLVRRMNGSAPYDTYYVYDDLGRLRYVLPPVVDGNIAAANLALYAYRYEYDSFGRCSKKWLPGAGSTDYTEYVYDLADRISFTQDGRQRAAGGNKWMFYLYDALGRLTRQGECTGKNASSSPVVHVQNFYDNYDFLSQSGFTNRTWFPAATVQDKSNARNHQTGSILSLLDGTGKVYVANYYDVKGRVTRTTRSQPDFCLKQETAYTFTGNPQTVNEWHYKNGTPTVSGKYTYTYDSCDRPESVKFDLNHSGTSITLAAYTYDKFGRLQSREFHGASADKLTYAYNLRGWLTGISGTKFAQNLYYNTGTGAVKYNGSISSMTWKAGNESTVRGYKFTYDGLDRMLNATYGETAGISTNANRFSENVTGYDKNGNIKGLQRYGQTGASAYGLVDNLTFTLNGNRLSRVDDAVAVSTYNGGFGFKDGVKQANEYAYDANGNLTKDLNKGISNISYNCLNLPSVVTFSDGSTITYTYAADGTKLKTVHKTGSTTTTTDYCGNVVYENGVQKLLLTDEGYVTLSDSKYHYYLKDHQGNNRVVINQSGTVEETNHYYPFGGVFASSGNVQPYKYNGKELDAKKGVNWYDYGARHYDAALGRLTTVDPLAEKYYPMSPYVYCGNNPIRYIDPTGMFYTGFAIDKNGYIQKVNNEGGDEYDVIYNKSKYSSQTRKDYDTSGNKTGIKISKGILNEQAGSKNMSDKTIRGSINDTEGHKVGEYANHSYEVKSDKEALSLMNFMDKNTNVEWGNTLMKDMQGNFINLLSTSHDVNTIKVGSFQVNKYIRRGFQIIRADHIHPAPGAKASEGDKGDAENIRKRFPDATFRILNAGKYYPY